jgi:hypothetical protein
LMMVMMMMMHGLLSLQCSTRGGEFSSYPATSDLRVVAGTWMAAKTQEYSSLKFVRYVGW